MTGAHYKKPYNLKPKNKQWETAIDMLYLYIIACPKPGNCGAKVPQSSVTAMY